MLKIFRQIKLTFPKVDQNKSIIRKLSGNAIFLEISLEKYFIVVDTFVFVKY